MSTNVEAKRSSDLLGPRASRPQMSAKREKMNRLLLKDCAPHGAFAGGAPAVPANHLTALPHPRSSAVCGLLFAEFSPAFCLFASPLPFPYNSQLARSAELSSGGFAPTFSFGRVIFGGTVDGLEFGGRSRTGNR